MLTTPSYLFPSIDHYCIDSLKGMLLTNSTEEKTNLIDEKKDVETVSIESMES